MEPRIYSDEEIFDIMRGMEEANRDMVNRIEAAAPMCHFRKMGLETEDTTEGRGEQWWECSVCGHTRSL